MGSVAVSNGCIPMTRCERCDGQFIHGTCIQCGNEVKSGDAVSLSVGRVLESNGRIRLVKDVRHYKPWQLLGSNWKGE